ncbi:hypothetical protein LMG31884_13720 [Xanthomonas hydrangeae]|nr:hypothetical protein LMG31884_13720 [Xanthomonas hydrangeae]CAD7714929.1 hypothetical protein LMG31884_13720 [Xanthomonas hydrangeae]CAD7725744.1 hypothetical protein LMG31887_13730 [Xanthomonas hydrangeae]CAD7725748.1 hypothetical protein LMG31887_13730 [Xanthomonas hydrangeae]
MTTAAHGQKTAARPAVERADRNQSNMALTGGKASRVRMDDWLQNVDRFAAFNERPLLRGAGEVSHERMQQIAHARYAVFDAKRRKAEAVSAEVESIEALESVEKSAQKGRSDAT